MPIFLVYFKDNKFTSRERRDEVCLLCCVLFDLSWKMASITLSPLFSLWIFILVVFPTVANSFHALHSHRHRSNATDEEALLAFKSAITVDPLHSLDNWIPNASFCKWVGVQCSHRRQRVVSLNLSNLALQGNISPLIGNLSFLKLLNLSDNKFDGHIPYQLGNLPRLRDLWLSHNDLEGYMPAHLSACRSLRVLRLGGNHLTGTIPSELGFLPNLSSLILSRNNLTGTIPKSLGNVSSLESIVMSENKLHGRIPLELGRLSQLKKLAMFSNHLTGEIPTFLTNCTTLQILDLMDNHLTGEIPQDLCFKNTRLTQLFLDINQLSGRIPVTLSNCTELESLELFSNQLSGIVPIELGKLFKLRLFNIGENRFISSSNTSLPIVNALINCSRLEYLGLSENQFTGEIPSSVGQLSSKLEQFFLYDNNLQGEIPLQIGNLTGLILLSLFENFFSGQILSTVSKLQRLQVLSLFDNNFEETIPKEINQLKSLSELYLSKNKLFGNIPNSLIGLQNIRILFLDHNQLTGNIPSSLGECMKLELLDMSYNKLTGSIPLEVAKLSNLAFYFNLSNNLLQGHLPSELSKMDKVLAIDISTNQLIGHIPNALGNCIALEYLNLSCNQLQGVIPDSLGDLKYLANIDLSSNHLSGQIPKSLGKLKMLQHLNLSFNKLSGEAPKDGVFKHLGPASFVGNLDLCGPWLKLPACSAPKHDKIRHLKRVIIPIVGATIFIWCLFVALLWRRYCMNCHPKRGAQRFSKLEFEKISLVDLLSATDGFNETNLLGIGSCGKVYKGVLKNGTMVAIKVLNVQNENAHKSFDRECNVLKQIRHRNLLRIITVYSDPNFKALIFPLMLNGSLDKFLYPHGEQSSQGEMCRLNLIQRLGIAVDIAQGIEYLHHRCFVQVIHCDLKPSNVLLGEDMTAYLSDFGISSLVFGNSMDLYTSTHTLKGSIGYIAPEYGVNGVVSTKGDVYSYGILLLEMVTRKKPTDNMFEEGMNLQKWVSSGFPNSIADVIDSCLLSVATSNEEEKVFKCLKQLMNLALVCTRQSPEERPTMIDIVGILHNIRCDYLGDASTSKFQSDLPSLRFLSKENFETNDSEISSTF